MVKKTMQSADGAASDQDQNVRELVLKRMRYLLFAAATGAAITAACATPKQSKDVLPAGDPAPGTPRLACNLPGVDSSQTGPHVVPASDEGLETPYGGFVTAQRMMPGCDPAGPDDTSCDNRRREEQYLDEVFRRPPDDPIELEKKEEKKVEEKKADPVEIPPSTTLNDPRVLGGRFKAWVNILEQAEGIGAHVKLQLAAHEGSPLVFNGAPTSVGAVLETVSSFEYGVITYVTPEIPGTKATVIFPMRLHKGRVEARLLIDFGRQPRPGDTLCTQWSFVQVPSSI